MTDRVSGLGTRRLWRRARTWPPLNAVVAPVARVAAHRLGFDTERLVRHLPRVGPAAAVLPDGRTIRLWSPGQEEVANRLYWQGLGGYEPETTSVFWHLARDAQVVIDAGAHVGYFSLLAALANPQGRVLAFEPLPLILSLLRKNVDLNGVDNVEIVTAALGDEETEADFHFVASDIVPTASSLSEDFMTQWGLPLTTTSVTVTTLDAVVAARDLATVDLVKIDTELTEYQVLSGMRDTIGRFRPSIVCEVLVGHHDLDAIERLVVEAGYGIFHLSAEGPVRREHIVPHWPERGGYEKALRNYLFTDLDDAAVAALWKPAEWTRAS